MYNPRLIITYGSRLKSTEGNDKNDKQYQPSGIVLLMLAKWGRELTKLSYLRRVDDISNLKRCKTNIIIARTSHYGSTGLYYSYGNRDNYGMINNSLVTQYGRKNSRVH